MLSRTSTEWAPRYIIPPNAKKFRNFVISKILVGIMEDLQMDWPQPESNLSDIEID